MTDEAEPRKRFGVWRIVGESVRIFGRYAPVMVVLVGPAVLLTFLSNLVQQGVLAFNPMLGAVNPELARAAARSTDAGDVAWSFAALPLIFFGIVFQFLAFAAVVHATATHREGGRVRVAESLDVARRRFVPVLICGILTTIAILAAFLLFIVPGLYVGALLAAVGPVVVLEHKGVSAFGRSATLTRGYRWPLAGVVGIYLGAILGVAVVVVALQFALATLGTGVIPLGLATALRLSANTFLIALSPIVLTLCYLRLTGDPSARATPVEA
jgi:hypothetical protein